MSEYHIALLVAALIAAAFSYKTPRALFWIGALTVSFVISVVYLYIDKPAVPDTWWLPASAVAALCDAAVCLLIYAFGKERWETRYLYGLVLVSVTVNVLYATGEIGGFYLIPDQNTLGIILEGINYAALLCIGGSGIIVRLGEHDAGRKHNSSGFVMDTLGRLSRHLRQPASIRQAF